MLLSEIISAFLLVTGPDTTTYPKYEKEQVAEYRKEVKFEYPAIEPRPGQTTATANRPDLPLSGGEDPLLYDEPAQLRELISRAKAEGAAASAIDGFRIQIYSGGDLEEANKIRADFLEKFPNTGAYRLWIQPTFRVRVGDFPTRNDASIFVNEMKKDFPGGFVVPDKIEKPRVHKVIPKEEVNYDLPPEGNGN